MKSIMKWIAGIFLAFSLILSFFTPFEKALTLNLLLFYFFVKQFLDSTSSPRTYQWIFQVIYLLIFSGLIWFNLRHGDMIVIATALSWLTVVCELWLYSQHK